MIDVDCNNESAHENNDLSTVYDGFLQLQSLSVDTEAKADDDGHTSNQVKIQSIQVFNAGESIVNGRYNLYSPRQWQHTAVTNSAMPQGPMYIHSKGPYLIQNEQYDVCLFQKAGYGDKVRWCIALVPSYFNTNESNDNNDEQERDVTQQNDGGEDRTRNFGLAYIYYWIEMNASSGDAAIVYPPLSCKKDASSSSSLPSWGVCHGTRPLPMLNDVSFGRKRWWQFWKD